MHSPEPWSGRHNGNEFDLLDANGESILSCDKWQDVMPDEADWHRIVACANACRGVPTAELVKIATWKATVADDAEAAAASFLEDRGYTVIAKHRPEIAKVSEIGHFPAPPALDHPPGHLDAGSG